MPGDASYNIIPSLKNGSVTQCVGLLAFHHGSETHMDEAKGSIPKALSRPGRIAFTFGLEQQGGRCHR